MSTKLVALQSAEYEQTLEDLYLGIDESQIRLDRNYIEDIKVGS